MSTDDNDRVGDPAPVPVELRSRRWYGQGPFSFEHRGRMMQSGFSPEDFDGKPVVGIVTTWSEPASTDRPPDGAAIRAINW